MTARLRRACSGGAAVVVLALAILMPQPAMATTASSTTSVPSPGAVALGDTVSDTATVSDPAAAGVPSGSVTFYVCGPLPSPSGCSTAGTPLGTVSLVQGTSNGTATSPSFVPNAIGTWCFDAEYSGDTNYAASNDGTSDECFTVGQAAASVVSTPNSQSTTLAAGDSDQVTVTGNATGGSPTGSVAFSVCGPLSSNSGCASGGTPVGAVPLTAGPNNTATATSANFKSGLSPGIWCFRADYSGDTNYMAGGDGSAGECFTVLQPGAPSATISSPTPNATYAVGQTVQANYSCAEASGGPGLSSCNGTAPNGAPIDTSTRGPHTFSVTAVSNDGLSTTVFVSYTVAGPPSVSITSPADGGTYTVGQLVGVGYSCAEDPFGPGLATCSVPATVYTSTTGTFPFTASATSLDGQTTTVTVHYTVVAPQTRFTPIAPPPSAAPPAGSPILPLALSGVRQSHRSWWRGGRLARITSGGHTPIGTTFQFTLNQPARMRFAFTQAVAGRKVRGQCVAPSSQNRGRPACTRTVTRGTLTFGGHSGLNKVAFQGRLSRSKTLKPGHYTLVVTATDTASQHATARLAFTITG